MNKVCDGKMNQKIRFAVFNKYEMMLNEVQVSVNELTEQRQFMGLDGSKLVFENFELYDKPTFLDYLKSGWQIKLTGAIDFTSANGKLDSNVSLHNLDNSNRYESALQILGSVLDPYSKLKSYTFFGFGGNSKTASIERFKTNQENLNPYVNGSVAIDDDIYSFAINGDDD